MIVTISMSGLVLALMTSGAIPGAPVASDPIQAETMASMCSPVMPDGDSATDIVPSGRERLYASPFRLPRDYTRQPIEDESDVVPERVNARYASAFRTPRDYTLQPEGDRREPVSASYA